MSPEQHQLHIVPHQRTVAASADRSLLDAALHAGLNLPHSCKSGHCSSCRARLIAGRVHYPHGLPPGITAAEDAQGFVLLCQARPQSELTVEARLIARVGAVEIKTLPCRIARLQRLAPDVMQVFLRLPSVESLDFQPGQYLDVLLEGDRRRSFSIASPPHDAGLIEIHVRHVEGGSFTRRLFAPAESAALREGSLLKIEGPIGQFVYRDDPRPAILIAGGTGFAPLKSMLRHVLERGGTRELNLYWGARTARDLYEAPLIESWLARYPQLKFTPVLSQATAHEAPGLRRGLVHEAVLADHPRLAGHEVYAAGPPAMIEAIRAQFPAHGLGPQQLYFDSFDYATEVK